MKSLQNLEALYLSGNPISTPNFSEFVSSIRFLSLPFAGISDLSFLEAWSLEGEVRLDFRGNLIHDLQPLISNSSLGEGAVISLRENCLDSNSESEDMRMLEALTARGINVFTDSHSNTCALLNTEKPDGLPLNTPITDSKLFRALAVQTGHFELTNVTVSKIEHLELNNDLCSVAWRSKYYEHLTCIQDLSGIENLDSLTELSLDIRMLNDLSILKLLPSIQHLALINGRELVNAGMPIFSFSPICFSKTDGNLAFDFTPLLNDEVFWQSETEFLTNSEISEEVKQLIASLYSQGVTVKRISDFSECFVHN